VTKLFLGIAVIAILVLIVLAARRGGTRVTTIETHRERKDDDA
jgi:Tfp pilus assembly protein FimT